MIYVFEGGNVFDNTEPVAQEDVPTVVGIVKRELPRSIKAISDIGSAGYKVESGDIDLFLDELATLKNFKVDNAQLGKKALHTYFTAKGYQAKVMGRNVHIDVPYVAKRDGKKRFGQVDLMVIPNAAKVADWHQHGPRGMYSDPSFKANQLFILLNSIGKFLGLKVDAFGGVVMRRDDNSVVADNRDDAAKLLLNPRAQASDLNSVSTVMKALANDPNKDKKLEQARQDVAKGLLTLPESVQEGSAQWFRKYTGLL